MIDYKDTDIALIYAITTIPNFEDRIKFFKNRNIIQYDKTTNVYKILDDYLKNQMTELVKNKKLFTVHKKRDIDFQKLAQEMISIYPSGIKSGTNKYWRGSLLTVTNRLSKLNDFTNDTLDIDLLIPATKKYIEQFNGDYRFMQTLPYFIFKNQIENGSTVFYSALLATLEDLKNPDESKNTNSDWVSNLV